MRRQRPRTPGITFESLESRIALSVSNDTSPLDAFPDVGPPPAVAFYAKAAAAAPAVFSNSASLARTAERITITGTGFNAKPAHNTVLFSGGVTGKVVSASPTQLVVQFTQKPVGVGTLSAVVTTKGQSSGAPVVVATVVKPPQVTANVASLSRSATVLTIQGSGFDPSNLTNRVSIVGNPTGKVIAATATTLTVAVTNLPRAGTTLKAVVKSFGGKSGMPVAVATIVRKATVTPSTQPIKRSDTTIQIAGTGFDTVAGNNKVTFNRGVEGYVTSATRNLLVVQITTPPTVGRLKAAMLTAGKLKASVTAYGGSSGEAVQVATVTQSPMVTTSSVNLASNAPTLVITGSGFSTTPSANTVAFNLGAAGTVTAATPTSLTVTFSTAPTSLGDLLAVVTTNGVTSGSAVQVATIVAAPTVTANPSRSIPISTSTLTIAGSGFNATTPSANTVAFNLGAVGTVTAATSTQLTVSLSTSPTSLGNLTAVVTSNGGTSGAPVQVATVTPQVASNNLPLAQSATTLVISGSGFSTTPSSNTVAFNLGAVGTVTAATASQLTVTLSTTPTSLGNLTAAVTTSGFTSPTVQVATVVASPAVTASSASLAAGATQIVIAGSGFNTNAASNTVLFNLGVVGTVTAATSTSLTVFFNTPPATLGNLTAVVTSNGGTSGAAVQVATVVAAPTVTENLTDLLNTATTLTISGTGFNAATPSANTVAFNLGAAGTVTTATSTSLTVTFSAQPNAPGSLTAVVTSFGATSGSPVTVATVDGFPVVTASLANLAVNASTLVITGSGFSTTPSENIVVLSSGAGVVTAATATQLTVTLGDQPAFGTLTAEVLSNSGGDVYLSSGAAVQVATVIAGPTVVESLTNRANNATSTLTITGTGFNTTTPSANTVAFSLGAAGTVTAATSTSLTVTFTTAPTSPGNLTAIVTSNGGTSGAAVQVATAVAAPTVTESTAVWVTTSRVITIAGTGFDAFTPSNNTVTFKNSGGVVLSTSILAVSPTLITVSFGSEAVEAGALTASVTTDGGSSGSQVQVATVQSVSSTSLVVATNVAPLPYGSASVTVYGAFNYGLYSFTSPEGTISNIAADYSSLLLTFNTPPAQIGDLTATITGTPLPGVTLSTTSVSAQVATIVPAITPSTASLANTTTITIYGDGFDTTAANNTVAFNLNAQGFVSSATSTELVVVFTALPTTSGNLMAQVSATATNGVATTPAQVATFYATPVVTASTSSLPFNATTVTIYGNGFDSNTSNNTVTFSNTGVTGVVTTATTTALTVTFDPSSTQVLGPLSAVVTTNGTTSGTAVQVATVVPAVTPSTADVAVTAATVTINGAGFDTTAANNVVSLTLGSQTLAATVNSATSTSLTVTLPTFTAITGESILTAVVTTDGYSSTSTQVATLIPPPTVNSASTPLYLMNGLTLAMPGTFYDMNPADYTVTFSNGAAGTVTNVTSSTLTVSFTTLPTTLGPMSATVTNAAPYGTTSATQSQVALVMPSLQNSTITCSPTSVDLNGTNGSSPTVTVYLTPYDQNGNLITSGASSITSYATFNVTLSITITGTFGYQSAVSYDSSTGAYTMTFQGTGGVWSAPLTPTPFNIDFYGFFDGEQISTYCWTVCST